MNIDRSALAESLVQFARLGSGVVVGAAGVGKTYLIGRAGDLLRDSAEPVFLLPIDQLGEVTTDDLERYLAFTGDLVDRLRLEAKAFSANQHGILLIDGFDAARSDTSRRNSLDLIRRAVRELEPAWHVVVSVRRYDAQKSQDLLELFPARSDADDSESAVPGISCRHFEVPELSGPEVTVAAIQVGLRPDADGRFGPVGPLLKIPFHLWLIERVLGKDRAQAEEISRAKSQAELLDIYWMARVAGGSDAESRQILIAKATDSMLRSRTLIVSLDDLYTPDLAKTLSAMLSDEIFVKAPNSQTIRFTHNILFDDMVSRRIPADSSGVMGFLVDDPARVLFLRPSLVLYYSRTWHGGRDAFWRIYWALLQSSAPAVRLASRLIPTRTIVDESTEPSDPLPVAEAVRSGRAEGRIAAQLLLRAIRIDNAQADPLWIELLDALSRAINVGFVNELMLVVSEGLEKSGESVSDDQLRAHGDIARRVVRWAWDQREQVWRGAADHVASNWATPVAVAAIRTAPVETAELINDLMLRMTTEPDFPVQYFYRLCGSAQTVWAADPDLAARVFTIGFIHQETSIEATQFGGVLLPLTSTRRQDFELAQYVLVRAFPEFLRVAPDQALRAGLEIVNDFAIAHHVERNLKPGFTVSRLSTTFTFRGGEAQYLPDLSYIWGSSNFPDRPIEIGAAVERWLEGLGTEDLDTALDGFRAYARTAWWWRLLLQIGTRAPQNFAGPLFELAVAPPVLSGADTIREAGQFLEAAQKYWSDEQRSAVETAVMALPTQDETRADILTTFRDRLLARLETNLVVTAAARQLREAMDEADRRPANEPLLEYSFKSEPYTREEWLRDEGADINRPDNQTLMELGRRLEDFTAEWLNRVPSAEAAIGSSELGRSMLQALSDGGAQSVVKTSAWSAVAGWAQTLSRMCPLMPEEVVPLCREILIAAAGHEAPVPDPERDAAYNSPSWYPAPRFEAAQGLPRLMAQISDAELSGILRGLCVDPVPGVRFLLADNLGYLVRGQSEDFWWCVETMARDERNHVVIGGLCRTIDHAVTVNPGRAIDLFLRLVDRGMSGSLPAPPPEAISTLALLALGSPEPRIEALYQRLLDNPIAHHGALDAWVSAQAVNINLRSVRGPVGDAAIGGCLRAVEAIWRNLRSADLRTIDPGTVRDLLQTVDQVAARLYFGAGLHDAEARGAQPPDRADLANYYRHVRPLITAIATFGRSDSPMLVANTAHYLMQLVRAVVSTDPLDALQDAVDICEAGRGGGYNLDSMAQHEVVELVEELLADHHSALRSGPGLGNLERLLNTFAEVGWPESMQLVWRLDEVFR
jgi:hypothetical protein